MKLKLLKSNQRLKQTSTIAGKDPSRLQQKLLPCTRRKSWKDEKDFWVHCSYQRRWQLVLVPVQHEQSSSLPTRPRTKREQRQWITILRTSQSRSHRWKEIPQMKINATGQKTTTQVCCYSPQWLTRWETKRKWWSHWANSKTWWWHRRFLCLTGNRISTALQDAVSESIQSSMSWWCDSPFLPDRIVVIKKVKDSIDRSESYNFLWQRLDAEFRHIAIEASTAPNNLLDLPVLRTNKGKLIAEYAIDVHNAVASLSQCELRMELNSRFALRQVANKLPAEMRRVAYKLPDDITPARMSKTTKPSYLASWITVTIKEFRSWFRIFLRRTSHRV